MAINPMKLCIFEDRGVALLEPLTLSRPAFELRCGATTLLDRQRRLCPAEEIGVLVRPELAELCRRAHPDLAVNDFDWRSRGRVVLVNARWLPQDACVPDWHAPRIGVADDDIAYVILPEGAASDFSPAAVADWKRSLPCCPAGGTMIVYPWDPVKHNDTELCRDAGLLHGWQRGQAAGSCAIIGPAEHLLAHAETMIEPFVTLDTRQGPVILDRGVIVHSFSRLEGPCYIGPGSWIVGGKVRGGTIGPGCRIGGEVEASIVQGNSNKYHDGFLGHSYVGEWVNLGAGTQVSDLRNDYGPVRVVIGHDRISTGLTKIGVFLGDHTKTGLGTLLNSGTVVGAFCNLLPSAGLLPILVPSFCLVKNGQIVERQDLRQAFVTAGTVLGRRGQRFTDADSDFYLSLYDRTAAQRQRVIRESDTRRWRKSI